MSGLGLSSLKRIPKWKWLYASARLAPYHFSISPTHWFRFQT